MDQLAQLLARADMAAILSDFGRRTRREDPVVHFYETFLAAYDPKMREARGVYYTPEPVVGYIVRSVDALLKRDFGMKDGLAHAKKIKLKRPKSQGKGEETYETHRLQILDPATGTGTFLYAVIAKIRESFEGNAGAWPGYVAAHLLPRLFGFELLMAPYAVAHMKLGLELEQSGYDFASDQRLGVFLTNSLEEAHELSGLPLFTQWLAEESRAAANVKRDAPVMVVLGNPPYSGHSANTGAWIAGLLRGHDSLSKRATENYFECDGAPLGERNPKWLNDDYVKFIRFAQWRIEQTGHGILAFVTNHGYLDNPTFRGMRESLMRGFDEIYLLDLHGNSKKKEKAPGGGKDENVFDIQQGVAIGIFVKHAEPVRPERSREAAAVKSSVAPLARVFRADLYGARRAKYAALDATEIGSTDWQQIAPDSPNFYFLPEDIELRAEYERSPKITTIMPINSVGIATARDALTIHFSQEEAWHAVATFNEISEQEAKQRFNLRKDARDWTVAFAKKDLAESGPSRDRLTPILYRPFDVRHTYYTGRSRGFHCMPRSAVMDNFFGRKNVGLVTSRLTKGEDFAHAQVTRYMTEVIGMSPQTSNNGFLFPLWLYGETSDDLLVSTATDPTANISPDFQASLSSAAGRVPQAEDVLAWIYAVLYTPSYRSRYADFLRRDFPRIPLPPGPELFDGLVDIGRELIALHVMEQRQPRVTRFDIAGSNEVVKVRWARAISESKGNPPLLRKDGGTCGRVYINDAQFFDGVPQGVWDTHIGGYRVAEKWLKDRKGRQLSFEDVMHYHGIVAALARTLELQTQLDEIVSAAGGWPLKAAG